MTKKSPNPKQTVIAPPGSDRALANGCLCPVIENGHGKGAPQSTEENVVYWYNGDCPLHSNGYAEV